MGRESALERCHPAVSFLFFVGAILFSVLFSHPAWALVSLFASMLCCLTLRGRRGLRTILTSIPLFLLVSLLNPLFNTLGDHTLLTLLGRPIKLESLCYGLSVGCMVVTVLLWFSCYHAVMTGDKFTALFGNLIPSLSLLLVMILRLVPAYAKKTAQITGARKCIGRVSAGNRREKLMQGFAVFSALTSWALESSVVTADSMRSRGYGAAKRTSFRICRFGTRDTLLLIAVLLPAAGAAAAAAAGAASIEFYPVITMELVRGYSLAGLVCYAVFLLLPPLLNVMEELKWHFLRSGI